MVDELDEITAHSDGKPVLVIMADGREILPDPLPTPGTGTGNFSRDPTWPSIAERPVF